MAKEIPLVSVIVPVYNAEKYLDEMLVSVRVQTLRDFELIIVDDCSTDGSCAIVESFIPKFDGRLKLISMKTNSGGPSLPRNKGLEISRGKYVFFMDNDDALINTALEEMYTIAEKYESDVLICKRHLTSPGGDGEKFLDKVKLIGDSKDNEISLIVGTFDRKVKEWINNFFEVYPWTKFVLRDFLVEQEIKFLPVVQEDALWTFEVICAAKRIILTPSLCYVHRTREGSITSRALSKSLSVNNIRRKMDRIIRGLKHVDDFMGRFEFFRKNYASRYAVLNHMVMQNITWLWKAYGKTYPTHVIYQNLKAAFQKETGEYDVLISYLITDCLMLLDRYNTTQKKLAEANEKLNAKETLTAEQ